MTRASVMRAACVLALWLGASAAAAQTTDPGSSSSTSDTSTTSSSDTSTSTTSASPTTTTSSTTSTTTPASSTSTSSSTPTATPRATSTSTSTSTTTPTHGATTPATGAATPPPEEEEGDGRDVDFLWIEAFGGVANVNLVAFGNTNFADAATGGASVFDEVNATGPMLGGALGFRIYWIAVGARTTFASYNTFQIGTVGGEVALRFPIPVVEPYIRAGFGYAWQGDANYTVTTGGVSAMPATTVYGWAFNAAIGLDIFVANWFTIGAGVGFDLLNMTRQSDPRMACMGVTDFCPMRSGDAVGYQLSGYGQIGFHI